MIRANILVQELRLSRRSLIIWSVVVLFTITIYLGFFPYMQDPDLLRAMESYPDSIRSAFNLSVATFADVNLYHGGLVMSYVLLLASIYAMMFAGSLIAREPDLGTAEFLYTRPIPRHQVMLSKVFAFVLAILMLWLLTLLASLVVGLAVAGDSLNLQAQLLVHVAGLLASLAAGGIAFAVAPRLHQLQSTTSFGVALGLGLFLVNSLSNMTDTLAPLGYATIYHYAGLEQAASGEPFTIGLAVLAAIFFSGTGLGLWLHGRRDFTG